MDMQLERNNQPEADPFDENTAPPNSAPSPPLGKGTKVSVYWTRWGAMVQWDGDQLSRLEVGDDGQKQRATHIQYDAVGSWRTTKQLSYWHCLDDEHWQLTDCH